MKSPWAKVANITQADWDKHESVLRIRMFQSRINSLGSKKSIYKKVVKELAEADMEETGEVKHFYAEDEEDVVNILQRILKGDL